MVSRVMPSVDPTYEQIADPLLSFASAFDPLSRLPESPPTVSEEPPRAFQATERLQPTSSAMFPDESHSYGPRVNLPRVATETTRSRLSQYQRDAARYGEAVGRGRAREGVFVYPSAIFIMSIYP